ncbi:MAG TPA: hypothetical protein VMB50_18435 [Myxococcales bacterium]|nr:hypothetical protein [Myxococcales bacterium]
MVGFENHFQKYIAALALCLPAGLARADFKSFAHIYPYFTQPQGGLEVEVWSGFETASDPLGYLHDFAQHTLLQEQVEVEYGITDHWDVSLYSVLEEQAPLAAGQPSPLEFDSFQVETRYRFAEKGKWPVDTELYLEIERPVDLTQPFELEGKLILAKDIHHFFVQANLIEEETLQSGAAFGWDLGLYAGAGYEIRPWIRVGLEALEEYQHPAFTGTVPAQETLHLGPSIALASSRLWFVITPAFRVLATPTTPYASGSTAAGGFPSTYANAEVGSDLRLLAIFGVTLN